MNFIKIIFFYSKISKISPFFVFYLFFVSFLIYFIFFVLKSRIIFLIFYFFEFLFLCINFTYFSYFKIYLTFNTFFSLFWQGFLSVLKGAFPFYPETILFLIDLPFLLLLLKGKNFKGIFKENKRIFLVFASIATIFLFFYVFLNLNIIKEKERIYDFRADFRMIEKFGLPVFQIENYLKKERNSERLKLSENFIEKERAKKLKNIIFIQVESLDSFILKEKFQDKEIMAYLNNLKEKSIFYPYVISYHYGGGTSDCEFSIFNSIEPLLDYPSIKIIDYDYRNSFLKILKKENYNIKAFHGNEGSFWNRDYAFPAMGFDEFYDIKKMGLKMKGWGAPDEGVFEFMLKTLREEKKPFFYFIITMSSHMPFTNVLNYYRNEWIERVENRVLRNYYLSMNYVDKVLEKYVEEFVKIPDTYIFIYGDHTGIQEEGGFKGSFIELDGLKVEFVPLIIISPENIKYREENLVASFLDFAPTALSASGVGFKYFTEGQNLLEFPVKNNKISPFGKKYKRNFLFNLLKDKTYKE